MPPANNLIGEPMEFYVPTDSTPSANGRVMGGVMTEGNAANALAFLLLAALIVLVLIRLAGLQGMIAIGR